MIIIFNPLAIMGRAGRCDRILMSVLSQNKVFHPRSLPYTESSKLRRTLNPSATWGLDNDMDMAFLDRINTA